MVLTYMRFIPFAFVSLFLLSCSSHKLQAVTDTENVRKDPSLALAEYLNKSKGLSPQLKHQFMQTLESDRLYWESELPKVLSGDKLTSAMDEIRFFSEQMEEEINQISASSNINKNLSELFVKNFSQHELESLALFLTSPEWKKYNFFIDRMTMSQDVLGLHENFNSALETRRSEMARRIFGDAAVAESVK